MSKRTTKHKHMLDERIQAVLNVIEDKNSISETARAYGIEEPTIQSWIRKYQADSVDSLKEAAKTWKEYSSELKRKAVDFYLSGGVSLRATCKMFIFHLIRFYVNGLISILVEKR